MNSGKMRYKIMDNIKAKHYIEYTKDGITDKFHEGDKVKKLWDV